MIERPMGQVSEAWPGGYLSLYTFWVVYSGKRTMKEHEELLVALEGFYHAFNLLNILPFSTEICRQPPCPDPPLSYNVNHVLRHLYSLFFSFWLFFFLFFYYYRRSHASKQNLYKDFNPDYTYLQGEKKKRKGNLYLRLISTGRYSWILV